MDRHLGRAHNALQRHAGTLTLEQLTARQRGKWTIAEILEHLARAFSATTVGARRALANGKASARQPDVQSRLRAFIVCDCGYLPTGYKAPKMVVPAGIDPSTAVSVATNNLLEMDAALSAAAARFGTGIKLMDHPILGPMSVRHWRKFHWVHTRHHVRQIVEKLGS